MEANATMQQTCNKRNVKVAITATLMNDRHTQTPKRHLYCMEMATHLMPLLTRLCLIQGCTEFDFFKFGRSRIWQNFGTQIRPKPKPNLAETCFLVTEQNTPVKILMASTMLSAAIEAVLLLLRYCLPVIDKICRIAMNQFCILNYFCYNSHVKNNENCEYIT